MSFNANKRFTKRELQNYLTTGDTNTPGDLLTAPATEFLSRSITFAVDHNPEAVYKMLKATYGKDFPNWTEGTASMEGSKETMHRYLVNKLANLTDAQKRQAAREMLAIRANKHQNNWTVPVN